MTSEADNVGPGNRVEPRRVLPESGAPDLGDHQNRKLGVELPTTPRLGDSKAFPKGTTSIDVEIFGSVYHVRGEQDSQHLLKLAEMVDGKMREISRHVPVVDSGKIAILAALNLADELLQCNNQQEGERVDMMEKVAELTGMLTEALDT